MHNIESGRNYLSPNEAEANLNEIYVLKKCHFEGDCFLFLIKRTGHLVSSDSLHINGVGCMIQQRYP